MDHFKMINSYTQTSDKEESSDYELSAMERDILFCTGANPVKLARFKNKKKTPNGNYSSAEAKKIKPSFIDTIISQKEKVI
jgi:hypothetical protein